MRTLMKTVWVLILLGGVALYWWFMHGWWQSAGDTLIERDSVRFGPVPVTLALVWALLLFASLALSLLWQSRRRTKIDYR